MTKVYFDIECYANYFYALFKSKDRRYAFRLYNDRVEEGHIDVIRTILKKNELVSFNGLNYDLPMLGVLLNGGNNARLKQVSNAIIKGDIPPWEFADRYPDAVYPACNHIDLVGVTPLQASLKVYGCRIHSPKLQDLPIHPEALITREQIELLERYCENDVDVTAQIYETMSDDIALREVMGRTYGGDYRSKSGPQIAEAVIRELMRRGGHPVEKRRGKVRAFHYRVPDFITFESDTLNDVLEAVRTSQFTLDKHGRVELPDAISEAIPFAQASYQFGIGGLHSQEKKQAVVRGPNQQLGELDVASMYPSIILGQQLYPKHLGPAFVGIYRSIYEDRIAAKHSGNKVTADSLKLVLNSSYGKFGSQYSFLYSPELLIQTTITGQLSLLMLIERLSGLAQVVSANTDGVVVLYDSDKERDIKAVARQWTADTTYVLEWTPYEAIYSESVNQYIAVKDGGGFKAKGVYAPGSIAKGYANEVCVDAICEYLTNGVPVDRHIRGESDVTKFLTMRGVRGGGKWREEPLGKVVRWYVGVDGEPIRYISNGNKVAGSDGAMPLMNLPDELPHDIDYEWYAEKAKKMMNKLGINYEL